MTSWSKDYFKYLHYASFRRYYPGRANDCFVVVEPVNLMKNPYIGDSRYNARILAPAFGVVCYNQAPPCHLKLDVSYVVPDRPLFLADVQNLLPQGVYIDPARYRDKVF
jgi:hypothetical protein